MSGSRSARSTNAFSCLAIWGSNNACGPPSIRATSTPAWPSTAMCPADCELLRDVSMWPPVSWLWSTGSGARAAVTLLLRRRRFCAQGASRPVREDRAVLDVRQRRGHVVSVDGRSERSQRVRQALDLTTVEETRSLLRVREAQDQR